MNISMKLVFQYMAIFFTFSPTSNHFHPLEVENCDSNSRLVVDEDDYVKPGLKGLIHIYNLYCSRFFYYSFLKISALIKHESDVYRLDI